MAAGEAEGGRVAAFCALAGEVVALVRDDMAHAAAGIGHVAEKARNDMDMDMRHRLPGGGTGVEAHVVAVGLWVEPEVEQALGLLDQSHQRSLFLVGRVKPRFDDSAGGDQHMSGRYRKSIEDCKSQIIRAKPIARRKCEKW